MKYIYIYIFIFGFAGDPAVGKSALAQMFRSDGANFQKNYTLVSASYTTSSICYPANFLSYMREIRSPRTKYRVWFVEAFRVGLT